MPTEPNIKGEDEKTEEYLKKETQTKKVYHYRDVENGFDVKAREVFKNGKKEVHYPFDREGRQKYKYVKSIEFKGVDPKSVKGIYKSPNFGLGFTKNLSPIIYELEKISSIKKIVISEDAETKAESNQMSFKKADLEKIFNSIKRTKDNQSSEIKRLSNNHLADFISDKFEHKDVAYHGGDLSLFIQDKQVTPDLLSEQDVDELVTVLPKHISEERIIYNAEEKINFIKLNKAKEELQKLVKQKTDTDKYEERCQKFFTENSWIFSNVLSIPIALLDTKTYVGGKSYDNTGGKEADFLYKNNLTSNVCIIEIKTPLKKIIDSNTPYRKPDIYSLGKELTGGVVQLLDQRDNLQKEFYSLSKGKFNSFTPKCILIIGKISDLDENQTKCFELFRNDLSNIEIITFDELADRTELILGEFIDDDKKDS